MQRKLGMGYQSEWASAHMPTRRERNAFYTAIGKAVPPGAPGSAMLKPVGPEMAPAEILAMAIT